MSLCFYIVPRWSRCKKWAKYHFTWLEQTAFHTEAEKERSSAVGRVVTTTSTLKTSRRRLVDYVENCIKEHTARAARLLFPIQPIKSFNYGAVVALDVVIS